MTQLQKEFYEKNKKLDDILADFNRKHKLLMNTKKNVIYPLQAEVKNLLVKVHGERKSNYKIISE